MTKQNRTLVTALSALTLCAGTWVYGATSDTSQSPMKNQEQQSQGQENQNRLAGSISSQPVQCTRASELIGQNVYGSAGKKLGDVEDLAIDTQHHRVAAVIVGRGGILGIGEKLCAVPPESLNHVTRPETIPAAPRNSNETPPTEMQSRLTLNMTQTQLQQAPAFAWNNGDYGKELAADYRLFNQTAYWQQTDTSRQYVRNPETENTPTPAQPKQEYGERGSGHQAGAMMSHELRLSKASGLMGKAVHDSQGEKVGDLKDFAVDLRSGRIVLAVIGSGGVVGIGETLHAVPPSQIQWIAKDQPLQLNVSKAKFDGSPQFKTDDWAQLNNRQWTQQVYSYYNQTPFWNSSARQPVRHHDLNDQNLNQQQNLIPDNNNQQK